MKYKNGKEYTFKFGNVTVMATFEGLTDDVADKFNRACAREFIMAQQQGKERDSNVRQRAYAGAC